MIDQDVTPRRRLHESVPCEPLPDAAVPDPTQNCVDSTQSSPMMPEGEYDGGPEVCGMYVTETCYDVEYDDLIYDDYDEDVDGMLPATPEDAVSHAGDSVILDNDTTSMSCQHDALTLLAVKHGLHHMNACMKMRRMHPPPCHAFPPKL